MALIILAHKIFLAILLFALPTIVPSLFPSDRAVERRFRTWDTEHYLHLAKESYTPKSGHCAFYPLWPLCISLATTVTGNPVVSGYLLANLFSFCALLLFHHFVLKKHDVETANRATLLLLLYPGSLFFFFPYTESLFLFLLMVCVRCLRSEAWKWVFIAAFLLPMTRATGVFIFPFLVWEFFRRKSPVKTYAICAAPLLGYFCYFAIMYFYTGNALEGFDAQQKYPARPSIARIADPVGFAQSFVDFNWTHDMLRSFVDRGFFLIFLISLFWILRADTGYYVYSIFCGLIPALSNILMSYTRFLSLVFPLFIVLGQFVARKWLFWLLAGAFGAGQLWLFVRHVAGRWAG